MLEDLQTHFQTLLQPLAPEPDQNKGRLTGLPKAAFVCLGKADTSVPTVITTSNDDWKNISTLSEWSTDIREQRMKKPPLQPLQKGTLEASKGFFNRITFEMKKKRSELKLEKDANVPERDMSAIRSKALKQKGIYYSHTREIRLPMSVPSFAVVPRCWRCQALFKYDASTVLKLAEAEYSTRPAFSYNLGISCAEVFANGYCIDKHKNANPVSSQTSQ